MKEALTEFENNVNRINDPDFGDFKRKAGNYITRFSTHAYENKEAFAELAKLKAEVLYGDNLRSPEDVRELICDYIEKVKGFLN